MYQPAGSREAPARQEPSLLSACLACCQALVQCMCCLSFEPESGEGGQRLLSAQQESSSMGIEAAASPPRLPSAGDRRMPVKGGQEPSSSACSSLPTASPPMPAPFFPTAARRHKRRVADVERRSGSGSGDGSSPEGTSPKAGVSGKGHKGSTSALSTQDDEDVCPTCLDPYTEHNPKVLTRCSHHFHLPCLYEWLERSETCPVCSRAMAFEEIV
ncbi:E3 ubiquitin-protein ligase [Chlorella vulgaris]